MNAIVRSTVFAVLVIAVIELLTAPMLAEAARRFHGTYAWTGFRSCVVSNQPFVGSAFTLAPGASISRSTSSESGTITFNLDGTGVTNGRASLMTNTVTTGAALGVAEFENNFTFVVKDDNTIETDSLGSLATTVLGSGLGGTSLGVGLRNRFQIVRGDMLVSAPQIEINPETIVLGGTVTIHRICTPHSFTATRLP
jgi:hypothetical protein